MLSLCSHRKGLPYRTLAVCLTSFVIVANVTFWVFTNSQQKENRRFVIRSSGSGSGAVRSRDFDPDKQFSTGSEMVVSAVERMRSGPKHAKRTPENNVAAKLQRDASHKEILLGKNILIYPELLETKPRDVSELEGRVIPNTVHYIWCGNRTFEYRHFLSVLASWRVLEPDAIEFRFETPPREDKYNTWFSYLRTHLAMFQATPLPYWVTGSQCGDAHGLETLHDRGGILVGTDVVMGPEAYRKLLYNEFTIAFKNDMSIGVAAARARDDTIRLLVNKITRQQDKYKMVHSVNNYPSNNDSQISRDNIQSDLSQTVETIKLFPKRGDRIFYCKDTELIKDLNFALQQPGIDDIYTSTRGDAKLCVCVDKRLQPRHVIEGHRNNPLASLLYSHVYGGRNTDFTNAYPSAQVFLADKQPHTDALSENDFVSSKMNQSADVMAIDTHSYRTRLNSSPSTNSRGFATSGNISHQPSGELGVTKPGSTSVVLPAGMGIPRLVHYVWFGEREMTFSMYLSFLSTVYVVKPDQILIHGDGRLSGEFWEKVKKHPLVLLVYRDPPTSVFSRAVVYTSHRSDIVRADVLDKYGGVYLDWDAYWLTSPEHYFSASSSESLRDLKFTASTQTIKTSRVFQPGAKRVSEGVQNSANSGSLGIELREADAVVSRDHIPRPPFPDTINMGVVLARPRSKFIRAWRAALVDYRSRDFLYNAVELPYKIYEMFPRSVVIDNRLQVMCYHLLCHPSYDPDFKKWNRAQAFNWTSDGVHAIHFTYPDPPAFSNLSALLQASGMFADMGRFIWGLQDSDTASNVHLSVK